MSYLMKKGSTKKFTIQVPAEVMDELAALKKRAESMGFNLNPEDMALDGIKRGIAKTKKQLEKMGMGTGAPETSRTSLPTS